MFNQATSNWSLVWPRKKFKIELLLSIIFLIAVLSFFSQFANWVEMRQGVVIADPILEQLTPIDLTWFTFGMIYMSLIIAIGALAIFPERFVIAIQVYTLIVLFRTAAMFVIPLEAPPGMIPLQDPLVEIIGTGKLLTRDLFFSGHTATMFILFLCVPQRQLRIIFLLSTFVLAACLLLQHVHYSVDVAAAPFFSYGAYRIVFFFHHKTQSNTITS